MTGTGLSAQVEPVSGRASRTAAPPLAVALTAVSLTAVSLLAACSGHDESAGLETAALEADLRSLSSAYTGEDLDALRSNDEALALGGRLFDVHCSDCHGSDGKGRKGVQDLTQKHFDYGHSADAVRTTIRDGRRSEMPAMGKKYGEVELGQIVSYVGMLGSDEPLSDYDERGRQFFAESCAACHGEDGRGQAEPGASNLVDDYWQHGSSMMNIRLAITRGVQSECPAQRDALSAAEIELLTAYTLRLAGR